MAKAIQQESSTLHSQAQQIHCSICLDIVLFPHNHPAYRAISMFPLPNVPKTIQPFNEQTGVGTWRLLDMQDDYVEIIRYQDKWNNEFAVLVNGVLMTPVGLPLPWGYEDYNIAQQNLEPIHAKFALGKSLVFKIR